MSKNYVSIRIKPTDASHSKYQAKHDTRVRVPSYLQTEPESILFTFREIDGDWTLNQSRNTEKAEDLFQLLDNDRKRQDEVYSKTHVSKKGKPKKRPRNAKPFLTGVITFTDPDVSDPEILRKKAIEHVWKLARKYNTHPLYVAEHRDEKTPHFHFTIPNLSDDGKSIAMQLDRSACKELQDEVAETFQGLGFSRGESLDMPTKHLSVRQGHRKEVEALLGIERQKKDAQRATEVAQRETIQAQEKRASAFRELSQTMQALMSASADLERLQADKTRLDREIQEAKKYRKRIQLDTEKTKEERKEEYRKHDMQTRLLKQEKKENAQEIRVLKEEIKQIEQASEKAKQDPALAREENIRDVFAYLIEHSTLDDQTKDYLMSEIGNQWPSSVPDRTWKDLADQMNVAMEKMRSY